MRPCFVLCESIRRSRLKGSSDWSRGNHEMYRSRKAFRVDIKGVGSTMNPFSAPLKNRVEAATNCPHPRHENNVFSLSMATPLFNHTMPFFTLPSRQAKAVKARKIGKAQENGGDDDGTTASANPSTSTSTSAFTSSTAASPAQALAGTAPSPSAGSKRGHDGVAKGGSSALKDMGSSPSTAGHTRAQKQTRGDAAQTSIPTPTSAGLDARASSSSSGLSDFPSPVPSPRLRRSSSSSVSWSALLTQQLLPPRGGRSPRAQSIQDEVRAPEAEVMAKAKTVGVGMGDVSGGEPEASPVGTSLGGGQHGWKKAGERAGGLTVVIPPVGSGAVVGHLRSPSEIMLDDIAESLADTTRKPSFARMQSVQVIFFRLVLIMTRVVRVAPVCDAAVFGVHVVMSGRRA